jgi:ketosteroid isomerase-like protein
MTNLATVQDIYDAFGQGDVPRILGHLSDDVVWEHGAGLSDVPWLQLRAGKEGAAAFLSSLADLQFQKFEPKTFLESNDLVVVLLDVEATVRSTGKPIKEEDQVHLWNFGRDGKVARFRHRVDTLQHQRACKPDSAWG